jgi:uncharacterized protein (DUF2147 family)
LASDRAAWSPAARAVALAMVLAAPQSADAAAASVAGRWLTDDGKAIVEIAACGRQMCGRIARVLDTSPGVPDRDVNNPDPQRRGRALIGLPILWGFDRGEASWEGGRAYDPKTGNSYDARLRLNADGSLRVTGCVLVVCRSKTWTRARS